VEGGNEIVGGDMQVLTVSILEVRRQGETRKKHKVAFTVFTIAQRGVFEVKKDGTNRESVETDNGKDGWREEG